MEPSLHQSLATLGGNPVILHAQIGNGAGDEQDITFLGEPSILPMNKYRSLSVRINPELWAKETPRLETHNGYDSAMPDVGLCDWKVISQLLRICRREQVSIWHGHDSRTNYLGMLLLRYWPLRLVTTLHEKGRADQTAGYDNIDHLCLPHFEKIICDSLDMYEMARERGVSAERCILIEKAIDTYEYRRRWSVQQAKERIGIHPQRYVIGVVQPLQKKSDCTFLVQTAEQLLHHGHNLEVFIVGAGKERDRLQTIISQTDYVGCIHLLDDPNDLEDYYESMDVLFFDGLSQGLSNVLLEALAFEIPVVATRCSNVARVITSGVNGLMIEPGSVAELVQTLHTLLMDADLRQQLSHRGREIVEKFYSVEIGLRKLQAVYDELAGEVCS